MSGEIDMKACTILERLSAEFSGDAVDYTCTQDMHEFFVSTRGMFREGTGHASPDGELRVIASADGTEWESAAFIQLSPAAFSGLKPKVLPQGSCRDLRDPRICVTPYGRLMLNSAFVYNDRRDLQSLAWFSDEQIEEESNTSKIMEQIWMVGADKSGLLIMDRELAARAYPPGSPFDPVAIACGAA